MKSIAFIFLALAPVFLTAQSDSNWFMGKTDKAALVSVSSTAELVETQFGGNYLYPPAYVLDGKGDTTWCPGGRGIDQALTIGFAEAISFDEIQIVNGFAGANDLYLKNNRVKTILITQVAGKHFQNQDYPLSDKQPTWQSIKFRLDQTAQTVTFTIKDIYPGYKYDDTCLSDIRFLYKGQAIPYSGADKLIKLQTIQSKAMLGATTEKDFQANYLDCLLVNADGDCYFFNGQKQKSPYSQMLLTGSYSAASKILDLQEIRDYSLARNRILVEQTVGYVRTKVSLIFVPDAAKGLTINGVYYRRINLPADLKIVQPEDSGPGDQ